MGGGGGGGDGAWEVFSSVSSNTLSSNSVLLDSREAHQLGGIARDSAIDRGSSTCQNQAFARWKRMLLAVKERYSFKDDLMPEKRKQTDMVKRHPLFERTCCGGSLT